MNAEVRLITGRSVSISLIQLPSMFTCFGSEEASVHKNESIVRLVMFLLTVLSNGE